MVTIIHCSGHRFTYPDVNERLRGKAFECRNCGLKVMTQEAARLLEGRTA